MPYKHIRQTEPRAVQAEAMISNGPDGSSLAQGSAN